jgi:hypothetical protein
VNVDERAAMARDTDAHGPVGLPAADIEWFELTLGNGE